MNKFDVFPKKLTIIGLVILASVYLLLIKIISRNKEFVSSFYTHDVPGLQLYCGASRLIAVNQLLESTNSKNINAMKINQLGVLYSLDEMFKLGPDFTKGENSLSSFSSVKKFQGTIEKDGSIVSSNDLETLKLDLQDFIESYLNRKNKLFEKQTELSNYVALIGVVGFFLFFGLIIYVYTLYRRNISALNELTLKMEAQQQVAVQASKLASVGEMAAGMAHEINNPLSIINLTSNSMGKMLMKDPVNIPAMQNCLKDIDETVIRISKIINGLRNISRDSTHDPLDSTPIKDIFNDVLGISTERLKANQVDLKIEDPENYMAVEIMCQRVQLSQVLLNLIGNAFDAIRDCPEKWISISLSGKNKYVFIKITDSGKGIPKEVREKMFLPFFTTKEIGKGTGLGLSISKGIIEQHGGRLYLDPSMDRTCFIIQLPMNF